MILVTGGTGLVGSYLLHDLLLTNNSIRAIKRSDSNIENTKKVFKLLSKDGEKLFEKIEWVTADITDIPALDLAFKNVTKVYHCAAVISFDPKDDRLLRNCNIKGTANVVNLCLSYHVEKLIYVSSIATLGEHHHPITEETYWNPEHEHNMYAITKYGAELEVWRGTQEGLDAVIVNPGVILGDVFFESGSGLLFNKIKSGFNYYTNGTVGFVNVKDVVFCMRKLMASEIKNEQFILVAENYSYKRLFSEIQQAYGIHKELKPVSSTLLKTAYILDYLKGIFTGKRSLHKATLQAANKTLVYDNGKVVNTLGHNFTPIKETIEEICNPNAQY